MNNLDKQQEQQEQKKSCCWHHDDMVRIIMGWVALIAGAALVLYASKILMRVLILFFGLVLIYQGLTLLNIEKITNYLKEKCTALKNLGK